MAEPTATNHPPASGGASNEVLRLGIRRRWGTDLYHFFLQTSWQRLVGLVIAAYLIGNVFFATLYVLDGDGIANARPGSFRDAFFFSVQTMSTIGYGQMAPRSLYANVVVTLEALTGLLGFAMATGLMFSKFARPSARVMFSDRAVISLRDGVPSLMFRMANERTNQIVEASLHVVLTRNETTLEGEKVRRFYDLTLTRPQTALFTLSWTAIHPIDTSSPMHQLTAEDFFAQRAAIVVSFMGFDETFSQTVHARKTYQPKDLVWGARFKDILLEMPNGQRAIDYSLFHETMPAPME